MDTRFVWGRGRHATAAERDRAITAYHRSGLTQREFAQRNGMQLSTLVRWLRDAARDRQAENEESTNVQFHSLELPAAGSWAVEVQKRDGTTIRLDHRCSSGLAVTVLNGFR